MKKILILTLALMLLLSLMAGCGGDSTSPAASQAAPNKNTVDLKLIKELEGKNIKLVKVYNEVVELAIKNGWEADALTVQELNAANLISDTYNSIIKDPQSAEGADMQEVLRIADDLIKELDSTIRKRVSVKYSK